MVYGLQPLRIPQVRLTYRQMSEKHGGRLWRSGDQLGERQHFQSNLHQHGPVPTLSRVERLNVQGQVATLSGLHE